MLKKLLFLALCGVVFLHAQNAPILRNGSFEELDEKGYPKYWTNKSPEWQSSDKVAYEGKRSMYYGNTFRGNYKFICNQINVTVGKTYEFSAVAKVVNKDSKSPTKARGSIFLEYYDDGKYLGGCYGSSTYSLNNEWMKITNKTVIPPVAKQAKQIYLGLLVSPPGTPDAEVWFDSVEIHEVEGDAFSNVPTTDCYRDEAAGGLVNVYCGCGDDPPFDKEVFRSTKLNVLKNNQVVMTCAVSEIKNNRLAFTVDSDKLSTGPYTLQCKVTDPKSGKTYTAEHPFRKLAEAPNYRVYVDRHRRLIVDGKPFFPLGMYFSKVTKEELAPYLDSDFNCLMPYQPPHDKETLDYIYENNLKLFFSIGHVSSRDGDKEHCKRVHAAGYAYIDVLKYHPAIIGWYINDELDVKYLQDAIDYRRGCEEHDPDRPTWSVLNVPKTWPAYTPASDIHGSDPYPIPESNINNAYKWAKMYDDAVLSSKLLIQVPQAFCWGRYWKKYGYTEAKTSGCPMPTEQEIEAMTWMSIAGGANGLMYYSYFDQRARDKEEPGLPAIPFDETFAGMKRLAAKIAAHFPVLLSAGNPVAFTSKAAKDDITVVFRSYELDGVTWILAVNTTKDKDGAFALEMAKPMKLAGTSLSDAAIAVNGTSVNGTLKPLQAIFIKLK